MENKKFTLEEVEKLIKNAYEVGLCDGIESSEGGKRDYLNSDDFWKRNKNNWIYNEINYVS
ncbi:MAG TPA: hypothetical protein PLC80_13420 [Draconibacterium sp.]|nr:hypothetical protein [Draconibacterium sp.]